MSMSCWSLTLALTTDCCVSQTSLSPFQLTFEVKSRENTTLTDVGGHAVFLLDTGISGRKSARRLLLFADEGQRLAEMTRWTRRRSADRRDIYFSSDNLGAQLLEGND